jgi:hypothetical protein
MCFFVAVHFSYALWMGRSVDSEPDSFSVSGIKHDAFFWKSWCCKYKLVCTSRIGLGRCLSQVEIGWYPTAWSLLPLGGLHVR